MKQLFPILVLSTILWADRGIIPPINNNEIYGQDQVAIIKVLPDSEELSILVKVAWTTDYNGFAWVVPFSSLPSISEINDSLFINLAMLSSIPKNYSGCGGPYYGEGNYFGDNYFKVIDFKKIGFLQTVLIQTNNSDTLVNWLIANGYSLPDGMRNIFSGLYQPQLAVSLCCPGGYKLRLQLLWNQYWCLFQICHGHNWLSDEDFFTHLGQLYCGLTLCNWAAQNVL